MVQLHHAHSRLIQLFVPLAVLWCRKFATAWYMAKCRQLLGGLYGEREAERSLRLFVACLMAVMSVSLAAAGLLYFSLGRDEAVLFTMFAIVLIEPFFFYKHLKTRWLHKRRRALWELPLMLEKMILLIQAGETIAGALRAAARGKPPDHPLYKELAVMVKQLNNNVPLAEALEGLNRRLAMQEISALVNALLLNHRRGGAQLSSALRDLAQRLWHERQIAAKTLGEEASSKLVLPMTAIFLIVMALVAAPAIMTLGS